MSHDGIPPTLLDFSEEDWDAWLVGHDQPGFRKNQILNWIYARRVLDPARMTNLPKSLRCLVQDELCTGLPTMESHVSSEDRSTKYTFRLADGAVVESVFMHEDRGDTCCLSSQVGCPLSCAFCLTGRMGFKRNLTVGEVLGQLMIMLHLQAMERPVNVVMMGMGEPLLNLEVTRNVVERLVSRRGLGFSARRVTVSTAGHVPHLLKLATWRVRPRIAISLNAVHDDLRNRLMPINRRWNLDQLIQACRQIPLSPFERITFEYVLIRNLNDSMEDALELARRVAGIRCKVNLIPYNAHRGAEFQRPNEKTIQAFRDRLTKSGVTVTVRWSKGADVGAACGQLADPEASSASPRSP